MLNQIVIAGRLVADPEITECENNKKRTYNQKNFKSWT